MRLESIGAAVEPERPGLVCFDARGLLRLHGGIEGVLCSARRALRMPGRFGVAPSRFAAVAAATRARIRRPEIVGGRRRAGRLGSRVVGREVGWARASAGPAASGAGLSRAAAGRAAARPARAGGPARGARAARGQDARASSRRCPPPRSPIGSARPGLLAHELARGGDSALSPRPAERVPARGARASRGGVGHPARAGARPADRSSAGPARAARADAAIGRDLGRAGGAGRDVARAGRVPRGAGRSGPDAPGADAAAGADARAGGGAQAGGRALRAAGQRPAARCSRTRPPRGPPGCARRSARPASSPGPMLRCGCWRSIPTRASPSDGRCWRRSRADARRQRLHR